MDDQMKLRQWSEQEREEVFNIVTNALPSRASHQCGRPDDWWQGSSLSSICDIYQQDLFMNEVYVHGFSNKLKKEILVVDVREKLLMILCYKPGYECANQISMHTAIQKLKDVTQKHIWLF